MTQYIEIEHIKVNREERQRRELKIDEGFKGSIRSNGVLQPIIVQEEPDGLFLLIAGERRLEACRELDRAGLVRKDGRGIIPARLFSSLSRSECELIELEENVKRLDLAWPDMIRSLARLDAINKKIRPSWSLGDLADLCNISKPTASMCLMIGENLSDPRVLACGGWREAYNLLLKRKDRAEGDAREAMMEATRGADGFLPDPEDRLERLLEGKGEPEPEPEPSEPRQLALPSFDLSPIEQADFLSWWPTYTGRRFSLIHCDFPYGTNLFSSNGIRTGTNRSQMGRDLGEEYDDSRSTYEALVEGLCSALPRLLAVSGHIMFWLDSKPSTIQWTMETFARLAPNIEWTRFPLIWLKSDNVGIAALPFSEPRHVYETCQRGVQGGRKIVKIKADAYAAPTDRALHPSTKPEAMLRHFMEMLVDEDSSIFDPTCGSGSALRAAESLGVKRVLGIESNSEFARLALRALEDARTKRRAAEVLGW